MGFLKDYKQSFVLTIVLLFLIVISIIPLDQFMELPIFLSFMENITLIGYISKNIQLIILVIPIAGLLLLSLQIWKKI